MTTLFIAGASDASKGRCAYLLLEDGSRMWVPNSLRCWLVDLSIKTQQYDSYDPVEKLLIRVTAADGTTYVCGISSDTPLPVDPIHVVPDHGGCEELRALTTIVAPELGAAEVLVAQACYRPIIHDGLPLIGAVPGISGAYIATGHSVWGMLNGPATAEAMAELIIEGATDTVDISPFRVERLAPLEASAVDTKP